MRALLVNQVPTILVVMNRFTDKYNVQIEKALEEQRMLILVLQRDEPHGTGQTPRLRNQYMMQMAENIVCGYIDKNGSIFPLLAGVQNVRNLEQEEMMMAAEPLAPPTHQRWTVWQDKILLRMFYEDMGLHAIKKQLRRSYISVRNRIKAITLPEEVLKGREFEDFVLELFDLNETKAYSLIEWRGDKSLGNISPVSNTYPDFVLVYKEGKRKRKFAVECSRTNYSLSRICNRKGYGCFHCIRRWGCSFHAGRTLPDSSYFNLSDTIQPLIAQTIQKRARQ